MLNLIEDNESTYQIIKTGKNPTMRHLTRTHGVHVSWLHDLWERKIFGVTYTRTEAQCADVFTKTFGDVVKWQGAIELIGMAPGGTPPIPTPEPGPRPEKDNKSSTKTEAKAKGRLVQKKGKTAKTIEKGDIHRLAEALGGACAISSPHHPS